MKRFDLPPPIYNALQRMVHGDYNKQRRIVDGFRRGKPGVTLEMGCGTGLLSQMFASGTYVGVDMDAKRIETAKATHPEHEFHVLDVTTDYSAFLERFDAVLFHGCIHHIDDAGVMGTLENIRLAAQRKGRPIEIMLIEPVLPEPAILNIPGFILAKLDRGRFVRKFDAMVKLFKGKLLAADKLTGPWYWPVPGIAMNVAID